MSISETLLRIAPWRVVQDNEFDLLFLKRRARQLGYELIIAEEDSGRFFA